ESDPNGAGLAHEPAAGISLGGRVGAFCLDAGAEPAKFAAVGLGPAPADHVLMTPPFNAPHNPSPDRARRLARAASPDSLGRWIDAAARLLRRDGTLTLIWRADRLARVLPALASDFRAIAIVAVCSDPRTPALP